MGNKLYSYSASQRRDDAYCPYSNYKVGSVVIASPPHSDIEYIFSGCNIENASYGLTICAERAAIFSMVSRGFRKIKELYCATEDGQGTSCGACRQVISEFSDANTKLYYCDKDGNIISEYYIGQLLPYAFGPQRLEK